MFDLKLKTATAFAVGALFMAAPIALADTSISIWGNGAGSDNRVSVNTANEKRVGQHNNVRIDNDVRVFSNTGGNRANFNTGGDVRIRTGDINSYVHINNNANVNRVSLRVDGDHFRTLYTHMNGRQEVPGPGDPNGHGKTTLRVHHDNVCVEMQVHNIARATAAHIHKAPIGAAGPVVVTLPAPGVHGYANDCVMVNSDRARDIRNSPSHYYINVHNNDYPDGAIRGQL